MRYSITLLLGLLFACSLSSNTAQAQDLNPELLPDTVKLMFKGSDNTSTLARNPGSTLVIFMEGDGTHKVDVDAKRVEVYGRGGAELELSGRADFLIIEAGGSGKIDTEELETPQVILDLTGTTQVKVNATAYARVRARGACDVKIKGEPPVTEVDADGGSSVKAD